jgi:hypothetical protein
VVLGPSGVTHFKALYERCHPEQSGSKMRAEELPG